MITRSDVKEWTNQNHRKRRKHLTNYQSASCIVSQVRDVPPLSSILTGSRDSCVKYKILSLYLQRKEKEITLERSILKRDWQDSETLPRRISVLGELQFLVRCCVFFFIRNVHVHRF